MSEEKQCSNTSCSKTSCEGCPSKEKTSFMEETNELNHIAKVIGIVSGKGGVGKSFVTASLAIELKKQGYKVGILDADITGPSIPKMFGIHGNVEGSELGIYPAGTATGIEIMSVNLMLEDEEAPVIWRGPVISGVVKQFWKDVIWGDLDYLLVDMPPGTGDVPLTVFQSLPLDGIVVVTSPQDLVKLIVKKAYNMAVKMNVPVLGLVENYSWLECPDCGRKLSVFGESKIDAVAGELNVPVLAKLPIVSEWAELADAGEFEKTDNPYMTKVAEALKLK